MKTMNPVTVSNSQPSGLSAQDGNREHFHSLGGGQLELGSSHTLLPGEEIITDTTMPDLVCLCVPWGKHTITLTNMRLLSEKRNFVTPGGALATASVKEVTSASVTKGKPIAATYYFAFMAIISLFSSLAGDGAAFAWGLTLAVITFVLWNLRPRTVSFTVPAYFGDLFELRGALFQTCDKNDRKLLMLHKYAAMKENHIV